MYLQAHALMRERQARICVHKCGESIMQLLHLMDPLHASCVDSAVCIRCRVNNVCIILHNVCITWIDDVCIMCSDACIRCRVRNVCIVEHNVCIACIDDVCIMCTDACKLTPRIMYTLFFIFRVFRKIYKLVSKSW